MSTVGCAGASLDQRATGSRRSSASPATRSCTTPVARPAASRKRPTRACIGSKSSTTSRCSPSARLPSRRPIRTSFGRARARRGFAVTSRLVTASTSRRTLARPGPAWVWRRRAASGASSSIPRTRRSSSHARWAPRTARNRSAAYSGRPTAARRGSARSSWTRTPAARRSRWIRAIRASSSPGCGSSRSTPGDARAAALAAGCSCRATAA